VLACGKVIKVDVSIFKSFPGSADLRWQNPAKSLPVKITMNVSACLLNSCKILSSFIGG
jgi:hypothetical protein